MLVTHDVGEAVTLADRILLIEDGAVALDLGVDLPRPRERGSAEFGTIVDRILGRLLRTGCEGSGCRGFRRRQSARSKMAFMSLP